MKDQDRGARSIRNGVLIQKLTKTQRNFLGIWTGKQGICGWERRAKIQEKDRHRERKKTRGEEEERERQNNKWESFILFSRGKFYWNQESCCCSLGLVIGGVWGAFSSFPFLLQRKGKNKGFKLQYVCCRSSILELDDVYPFHST